MIVVKSRSGLSIPAAVQEAVKKTVRKVRQKSRTIGQILKRVVTDHFRQRFPGSKHYSPRKILAEEKGITIDIPGISRAFRSLTIYPRIRKALSIPIHKSAYGKKPGDFKNIFRLPGTETLFMKKGRGLIAMYTLKARVFQKQDRTILPPDDVMQNAIGKRFIKFFDDEMGASIQTL